MVKMLKMRRDVHVISGILLLLIAISESASITGSL